MHSEARYCSLRSLTRIAACHHRAGSSLCLCPFAKMGYFFPRSFRCVTQIPAPPAALNALVLNGAVQSKAKAALLNRKIKEDEMR